MVLPAGELVPLQLHYTVRGRASLIDTQVSWSHAEGVV